jgi:hypothetical protein
MIARAILTQQILENPTKNRVTACRRRVRDNRNVDRLRRREAMSSSEQSAGTAQFPADSLQVRQLVTLELSPALDEQNPVESVVEEVGIT